MTLSEKIEFLRANGYTQAEIAILIECTQGMVSILRHGYEPENKRLEKKIDILYKHELKRYQANA